jgi:phage/plasmid primase-like uncharacterized protein
MIDTELVKGGVDLRILAARYTRLRRWANGELAGPCPRCGGKDRFHVRASWWKCYQCHPARADAIELVQWLGLASDFHSAVAFLEGSASLPAPAPAENHGKRSGDDAEHEPAWHSDEWQHEATALVGEASARLADQGEGEPGRAYLRRRGLTPETWRAWGLGYAVVRGRAAISIPWRRPDGAITALQYRFIEANSKAERFACKPGSERAGLFGLDQVRGRPTLVVCEGEINAVSLWQAAGDVVDAVSFGSEGALARPDVAAQARAVADRYDQVIVWADAPDRALEARAALGEKAHALRSPLRRERKLDANELLQEGALRGFIVAVLARLALQEPADALAAWAVQEGATVVGAEWEPERLPAPLRAVWDAAQARLDDLEARWRKGTALLTEETDARRRERYRERLDGLAREIAAAYGEIGGLPVGVAVAE